MKINGLLTEKEKKKILMTPALSFSFCNQIILSYGLGSLIYYGSHFNCPNSITPTPFYLSHDTIHDTLGNTNTMLQRTWVFIKLL